MRYHTMQTEINSRLNAKKQFGRWGDELKVVFEHRVGGAIEAACAAKCKKFIFSSTCATYGEHDGVLITEETPQAPPSSPSSKC
mgnify:CR=1 FL=1